MTFFAPKYKQMQTILDDPPSLHHLCMLWLGHEGVFIMMSHHSSADKMQTSLVEASFASSSLHTLVGHERGGQHYYTCRHLASSLVYDIMQTTLVDASFASSLRAMFGVWDMRDATIFVCRHIMQQP